VVDESVLGGVAFSGTRDVRAIILCAGEATRWDNYMNTPKHLIEIEGEKILDRTVRLLRSNGVDDIYVVARDGDDRYRVSGSKLYVPALNYEENADADKFLSSKSLWNTCGRTIVIYGDCYFTEAAVATIVAESREEWLLFCRPTPSVITGTPWGECFAQSFYPQHLSLHEEALHRIARLYKSGVIKRCGGWEHYNAIVGRGDDELEQCDAQGSYEMRGNFVEINDWTEDFDFPEDYIGWVKRRALNRIKEENSVGSSVRDFLVRGEAVLRLYLLRLRRAVRWAH
jgi:Predicted sugar nucleotidyltransferases